jgi:FkbM family methyltransferase
MARPKRRLRQLARGLIGPGLGVRRQWTRGVRAGFVNYRVIDRLVRPGMVAVDVGASTGTFSMRMLQLVGHTGHVYAIEPHPCYEQSLALIRRHNPHFTYFLVGASDQEGLGKLMTPTHEGTPHRGLSSFRSASNRGGAVLLEVPLKRIDDLIGERTPVAFVKIDVEGYELAVLAGARRMFESRPTTLIEIEQRHHASPITEVFDEFRKMGYEGWALFERGLRPIDAFDIGRDQERFLTDDFQDFMPRLYVNDFLFMENGACPPTELMDPVS